MTCGGIHSLSTGSLIPAALIAIAIRRCDSKIHQTACPASFTCLTQENIAFSILTFAPRRYSVQRMPILSKAERETIVRFDDSEKTCDIYTASPVIHRRLLKRGYPMVAEHPFGWRARAVPLKALSFRKLESLTKAQGAARRRGNPSWVKKLAEI